MRRTLTALVLTSLLAGIVLGVVLTFAAVEMTGGWYTYRILSKSDCEAPIGLGISTIAPGQPHPCLVRTPRFIH